jgi:hypothetical protein
MTIIKNGELEAFADRAIKKGVPFNSQQAEKIAREKAMYYLFREKPGRVGDIQARRGQGYLLASIDQGTQAMEALRKVPGVRWVVPFLHTPMNIFKQGIEYSPLGVATIPGAQNKQEQVAKSIVGSTVFAGTAAYIFSNDSTWAAPSGDEEKSAFYASGRQPYSIKVGDRWVSYSKLGPIAYPMAMAAALKHYTQQDPDRFDKNALEKITSALVGISGFFADQSYVQGLDNLINLPDEGWKGKAARAKLATAVPTQLIPLSSLVGWVNRNFIDPVYREVERPIDSIKASLPGLSKQLEAHSDPNGDASVRRFRLLNAFSPVRVTPEDEEFNETLRREQGARSYWEYMKDLPNSEKNRIMQDLYQNDESFYKKLEKEVRYDQLGLSEEERGLIGTRISERADTIVGMLANLDTNAEKNELVNRLYEAGIWTDATDDEVRRLLGK